MCSGGFHFGLARLGDEWTAPLGSARNDAEIAIQHTTVIPAQAGIQYSRGNSN
jgi:hypothetical protein